MKKIKILQPILFLSLAILTVSSCKKEQTPDPPAPPLGLEQMNLPGAMMTLSAISYVAESQSEPVIRDSINVLLSDSSLATLGRWQLVWGPGISGMKSNLSFVASMKTSSGSVYAIAIRGTNSFSIPDILQDMDVFVRVPFTYGEAGDSVARGAMNGFDSLLIARDAVTGKTLEEYLQSLTSSQKITLFVTGHSQGGGLAPLMAYWTLNSPNLKGKFISHTIAFAGPGVINQSFATNFSEVLKPDGSFQMKVNSKDAIPWAWASVAPMLEKNIPVHVPFLQKIFFQSAQDTLNMKGIVYVNAVKADSIGFIPITENGAGGITPADSIKWYDHWVEVEHNHNNYLKLLGVKPLKGN